MMPPCRIHSSVVFLISTSSLAMLLHTSTFEVFGHLVKEEGLKQNTGLGEDVFTEQLRVMERHIPRNSFITVSRSNTSDLHEVVFAVKQRNLDVLEKTLMGISTPGTDRYQQWLSFDEVSFSHLIPMKVIDTTVTDVYLTFCDHIYGSAYCPLDTTSIGTYLSCYFAIIHAMYVGLWHC